jgi:hypothetical protein
VTKKSPFCPTCTSFGAWPRDHHIIVHNFSQPTNIHTKVSPLRIKLSYRGPCSMATKVQITLFFPHAKNIRETGKSTCYLTMPTHVSPMIYTVHMVTHSMNRSLGPLAGTTMNHKILHKSTHAFLHHHKSSSS